jgi:hypothetical protein
MSDLLSSLKDIIKHTSNLGFVQEVKIIGTDTSAKIEALDENKTVVVFGTLNEPVAGIDSTIGLSRIGVLKGYIDLMEDASTVEVVKETRNSVSVPVELKFDNQAGTESNYRFMSETMINELINIPPFKGAVWNLSVVPDKKNISMLNSYQGILGGFEKRFSVSTNKNNLVFSIGSGPTDRANVTFATNINGALKSSWSYPLSQVLSILKLYDSSESVVMNFSDMGALKIDVDSGVGKYSYILPAGQ